MPAYPFRQRDFLFAWPDERLLKPSALGLEMKPAPASPGLFMNREEFELPATDLLEWSI